MKKIGIVGFGRFGELLASLSKDHFAIYIVEPDVEKQARATEAGYTMLSFDELSQVDFIFLAVPISALEQVILELAPLVRPEQVVVDLCSVKVYPAQLMQTHLSHCQTLATHPMFGPDSAQPGLYGLQVAVCPLAIDGTNLAYIRSFWADLGATVITTTPEAHDKDTVYSQAFTYSLAQVILGMEFKNIVFRTRSFEAISEVARLSAKDSAQLFHDMLFYNPYFGVMKTELEASMAKTQATLEAIAAEQVAAGKLTA